MLLNINKKIKIKDFLLDYSLKPKGRKMARTISVHWHEIPLQLTIERRFDKNDNESFVFLISTYFSKPIQHVLNYKKRWPTEKCNRTIKQYLCLQECFFCNFKTQQNHSAAVLLAYSLAQIEMKKTKLKRPEQAIRRLKTKNVTFLINRFARVHKDFFGVDA